MFTYNRKYNIFIMGEHIKYFLLFIISISGFSTEKKYPTFEIGKEYILCGKFQNGGTLYKRKDGDKLLEPFLNDVIGECRTLSEPDNETGSYPSFKIIKVEDKKFVNVTYLKRNQMSYDFSSKELHFDAWLTLDEFSPAIVIKNKDGSKSASNINVCSLLGENTSKESFPKTLVYFPIPDSPGGFCDPF
ncbi:hypothetical protein [Halobacteriovorax sp. BALOs_7]|uniref:hypothetical protein n=1 Tax=Halobacteriovorax sp. BALOs_7 TaxID=2109558 RepID=UPI000EA0EB31|nr:hypothetical protein [Halobacteriovorax sp. BALOs_7]